MSEDSHGIRERHLKNLIDAIESSNMIKNHLLLDCVEVQLVIKT